MGNSERSWREILAGDVRGPPSGSRRTHPPTRAGWLQEPGDGPALEFEQLLKIHFADSGTKADILVNLEAARTWVLEQNRDSLAAARAYLAGQGSFPERAALNQLGGRFLTDFDFTVARWAQWATEIVDGWPDDVRDAPFDVAAAQQAVDLAESIEATVRSPGPR